MLKAQSSFDEDSCDVVDGPRDALEMASAAFQLTNLGAFNSHFDILSIEWCTLPGNGEQNPLTRQPRLGEPTMSGNDVTKSALSPHRRVSLTAGILYLLTFVSMPTLALYGPVLKANYVMGSGPDTGALVGGFLEIVVALAGIATAVVLFPVLKKQSESGSIGLIAARILESSTIFVGVAFVMSIVALRKAGVGASALATSHALVNLYDRIFILGQSFMPAVCDLLLGIMLYKSRLVPRRLALIGIVGAPVLLVGYFAMVFGNVSRHGPVAGLSAVPVAVFEFSLGIWLIVKGFNPVAVADLEARSISPESQPGSLT